MRVTDVRVVGDRCDNLSLGVREVLEGTPRCKIVSMAALAALELVHRLRIEYPVWR